jgi:hypothetical protein
MSSCLHLLIRPLVLARKSKEIVGKGGSHVIAIKRNPENREQFIKTSVILYLEKLLKKNLTECRITLLFFFRERTWRGFPPLAQVPSGWKIVVTAAFTVMNLADTLTHLLGFGVSRSKSFMKS